jgi:hypothetical protein
MSVGVLVLGASVVYALGDTYGFGAGLLGVAAFAIGVAAIPALIARWVFAKTRAS